MSGSERVVSYPTKSGRNYDFDVSDEACLPFGFRHNTMLVTPENKPAKVIGVRNDQLWLHVDGDSGASFWGSCRSQEDFFSHGFRLSMDGVPTHFIFYATKSGKIYKFDASDDSCRPFGFVRGDVIKTAEGKLAHVVGVYESNLWFHVDGDAGASFWGSCRSFVDFQSKGFERAHHNPAKAQMVAYKTKSEKIQLFDISSTVMESWGLVHGQNVQSPSGRMARVVGVSDDHMWFHVEGDIGASFWGTINSREDLDRRGFVVFELGSESISAEASGESFQGSVKGMNRRNSDVFGLEDSPSSSLASGPSSSFSKSVEDALELMDQADDSHLAVNFVEYMTVRGSAQRFNTSESACKRFGFHAGERIITPDEREAVVIGVGSNGHLWMHIDGDPGASFFGTCTSSREFISRGFRSLESGPDVQTVMYHTRSGNPVRFDIRRQIIEQFGFRHGETILTDRGKRAAIVGVHNDNLWLWVEGDTGASYWSSLRSREDFERRGFILQCDTPLQGVFSADTYSLGAQEFISFPAIVALDGVAPLAPHPDPRFARPESSEPIEIKSSSSVVSHVHVQDTSTKSGLNEGSSIGDLIRFGMKEFQWPADTERILKNSFRPRYINNVKAVSKFLHKSASFMELPDTLWELVKSLVHDVVGDPAALVISDLDHHGFRFRSEEELRAEMQKIHEQNALISNDPNFTIPEDFLDPISYELFSDPVVLSDGRTYERASIELWLRDHDSSPITNSKLEHQILIPNYTMRSMVNALRENWRIQYRAADDASDADEQIVV